MRMRCLNAPRHENLALWQHEPQEAAGLLLLEAGRRIRAAFHFMDTAVTSGHSGAPALRPVATTPHPLQSLL